MTQMRHGHASGTIGGALTLSLCLGSGTAKPGVCHNSFNHPLQVAITWFPLLRQHRQRSSERP